MYGSASSVSSIDYNGENWMKMRKRNQSLLSTSTIFIASLLKDKEKADLFLSNIPAVVNIHDSY